MFSFCANFSYFQPMPMFMPFGGGCCCGGGNSFWGSFLGATLGSYLSSSNAPVFNNNYYTNNFSYGPGAYSAPSFTIPANSMPYYSMPSIMMTAFNMPSLNFNNLSVPQMNFSMPQLDFSSINSSNASSPFSSSLESYNPFTAYQPETKKGSTFNSDDYMAGSYAVSSVKSGKKAKTTSTFNTNTNLPQLKSIGYNASKGARLANEVSSHVTGFDGACGTKVREAMERAGLANGKRTASAADFGDVLLKQKNFKEVSAKGIDLKSLPAGCVLVYGRGVSDYNEKDGHVEITLGDGRAASDGITNNIRPGARIFIPV